MLSWKVISLAKNEFERASEEEKRARRIQHLLEIREMSMVPISRKDENACDLVEARTREYIESCFKYNQELSWGGLATAFGVTEQTVCNWRDGLVDWARKAGITDFLQKHYTFMRACYEAGMMDGSIPAVQGIFLGKNNLGYKNDDIEQKEITVKVQYTQAELIEQAKNLIDQK